MQSERITSFQERFRENVENGKAKIEAGMDYVPEFYFDVHEEEYPA